MKLHVAGKKFAALRFLILKEIQRINSAENELK